MWVQKGGVEDNVKKYDLMTEEASNFHDPTGTASELHHYGIHKSQCVSSLQGFWSGETITAMGNYLLFASSRNKKVASWVYNEAHMMTDQTQRFTQQACAHFTILHQSCDSGFLAFSFISLPLFQGFLYSSWFKILQICNKKKLWLYFSILLSWEDSVEVREWVGKEAAGSLQFSAFQLVCHGECGFNLIIVLEKDEDTAISYTHYWEEGG